MIYQAQVKLPSWIHFGATLSLLAIPQKICSLQKLPFARLLCVVEISNKNPSIVFVRDAEQGAGPNAAEQPACVGGSLSSYLLLTLFWPEARI